MKAPRVPPAMTRRQVVLGGLAAMAAGPAAPSPTSASVIGRDENDWRVFDAAAGRDLRWRDLLSRLERCDAVFLGEQHGDPETHRAEAAILAGLHDRIGGRLTLALEMFERDGQPALDDYLAGRTDEAALGRAVTLWPNYATDYRPLIELAKARRVPVLASNAPARIVRAVGRDGLAATWEKLTATDRRLVAAYVSAPSDAYWDRFRAVIGPGHRGAGDPAAVRRFYEAQCLRDDTMAETVANALAAGRAVLHVNGSFHSDAGLGAVARVLWRRPLATRRLAVVKFMPVKGDPSRAETGTYKSEADFVVFVPDRKAPPVPAAGATKT